jgi:hypothetical protein
MRLRPRHCSADGAAVLDLACDYGAGGAALFDIVNIQMLDAAPGPGARTRSLPARERRRDPFCQELAQLDGQNLRRRAD